jgi:recombinational DNA repair protein RecR
MSKRAELCPKCHRPMSNGKCPQCDEQGRKEQKEVAVTKNFKIIMILMIVAAAAALVLYDLMLFHII